MALLTDVSELTIRLSFVINFDFPFNIAELGDLIITLRYCTKEFMFNCETLCLS